MSKLKAAAAALVLCSATAGAATPAPTVQPLLIVADNDSQTLAALTSAVQRLVARGDLKADTKRLKSVAVGRECIERLDCVAARKQLQRHGGKVAVIAWAAQGRTGLHEVRCVGSDPLRHYTARIDLRLAASGGLPGARRQLTKLASFIVDMALPPKRAE